MIVAVLRETFPGERRVALIPAQVAALAKAGLQVLIESGAGSEAGYPDQTYVDKEAEVVGERAEVFRRADVLLQVRCYGSNPDQGAADLEHLRPGQIVIGQCDPLTSLEAVREMANRRVTQFSLELVPRITRAQTMDVLSSMATIAGYKAVLIAAETLPKIFPMLMTAAGTVAPARVLIIGAGVAGLQAIATARRLGAIVSAYDVRPAAAEQVESMGAKFVKLDLQTEGAEGAGGYAKAMDEEFYNRQREQLAGVIAEMDVVVTTAAIPGKPSPLLITANAVERMAAGSVIVDLAAERGGNCERTRPGETTVTSGVTILAPLNLPSTVPHHASQMYSKNISAFLLSLVKEGNVELDRDDEVVRETLVTHGGEVVQSRVQELCQAAGTSST